MDTATPELAFPFPAVRHPDADEIAERTVAWIVHTGLADDRYAQYAVKIGLGHWFPGLLPDGDPDVVLLGSQLTAWFTLVDDHVMEAQSDTTPDPLQALHRLLRCEEVGRLPETARTPLEFALVGLMARLDAAATPEQMTRFHWHVAQYYLGVVAESTQVTARSTPAAADYRRIRHLTTCIPPFFVLSEIARGHPIPAATVLAPPALRLAALAVDLTAVHNDIVGLRRDVARGDTFTHAHSLVADGAADLATAVAGMVARMRRDTAEFATLSSSLTASGDAARRHIAILRDLVAGHLAWTTTTPRYHAEGWF